MHEPESTPIAAADVKPALLFLCAHLPLAQGSGEQARSFHLLRHLARTHRVYLGAELREEADWDRASEVQRLCEESHLTRISTSGTGAALGRPFRAASAKARGAPGRGVHALDRWVGRLAGRESFSAVFLASPCLAGLAEAPGLEGVRRVIDFRRVEAHTWRLRAERVPAPASWLHRRRAFQLLERDRQLARTADAALFVSRGERDLFRSLAPEAADRAEALPSGVDAGHFRPVPGLSSPYGAGEKVLLFWGMLDHWPNVDGLEWFMDQAFRQLHDEDPSARLYMLGPGPGPPLKRLAERRGVVVRGAVADVRPYLQHARAALAPLRVPGGAHANILPAMAMERPLIATGIALGDTPVEHGVHVLRADGPAALLSESRRALREDLGAIGRAGRRRMIEACSWEPRLQRVSEVLRGP